MAQVFPQWANRVPIYAIAGLALLAVLVPFLIWYYFSPWYTDVGYRPQQPVPFSHRLHAGDLAIDCRYCHAMVERSAVATVPPTKVCMNCHTVVGRDRPTLEPVRQSAATGRPLLWVRVHELPDYAYFDHSMHWRAGVGCSTCHGDVAAMDEITQMKPLSMSWCLDCHHDPTPYLRRRNELTNTSWTPPGDQATFGREVAARLHLAPPVTCGGCHR